MSYNNELKVLKEKEKVLRRQAGAGKRRISPWIVVVIAVALVLGLASKPFAQEITENQDTELAENEISVEEMIKAYNSVEVKAEDATLNIILGLYNIYKDTHEEKIVTGETMQRAMDELDQETELPLKRLDKIIFDREKINLVLKKKVNVKVPGTMGAARIVLSKETSWNIVDEGDDIISVTHVEGTTNLEISRLARGFARKVGIVPMKVHNAVLATYENREGKKALYGALYSAEQKKESNPLYPMPNDYEAFKKEYSEKRKIPYPPFEDLRRKYDTMDKEEYRRLSKELIQEEMQFTLSQLQEKYGMTAFAIDYYYYDNFNAMDLSNYDSINGIYLDGTTSSSDTMSEGFFKVYSVPNKKAIKKTLRQAFLSNPDIYITISSFHSPLGLEMPIIDVAMLKWTDYYIYLNYGPYYRYGYFGGPLEQIYADAVKELIEEGFIEEIIYEHDLYFDSYFYRLKKK